MDGLLLIWHIHSQLNRACELSGANRACELSGANRACELSEANPTFGWLRLTHGYAKQRGPIILLH